MTLKSSISRISVSGLAVVLVCAGHLVAGSASATVVSASSQGINFADPNATPCSISSNDNSVSCVSGPNVISRNSSQFNGGIGFGSASANIVTGQLKAVAQGTAATADQESDISATGGAEIEETFSVSGNGTVTALLDVDGFWNVFSLNPNRAGPNTFQIRIFLSMSGNKGAGSSQDGLSVISDFSGSIDQTFQAELNVFDGTVVDLSVSILAQLGNGGQGIIDLSNTASLLLQTSSGVDLTFSDPDFLANPAFGQTSLPEPETVTLLVLGLAGLGLAARRSRMADAKPQDA